VIVVNDGTAFSQPTRDLIGSLGALAVKTKGGLDARAEWLLFLDDDDLIAVIYWQAVARYIDAHFQSTDLAYGFYRASSQSDRTAMQRVAAAQTMFHSQLQEGTSLRSKMQDWASDFGYQKPYFKRSVALTAELRTNSDTDFYHKFLSAGASCHNTPSDGAIIFKAIMVQPPPAPTQNATGQGNLPIISSIF
jgi:hypothetical protein